MKAEAVRWSTGIAIFADIILDKWLNNLGEVIAGQK